MCSGRLIPITTPAEVVVVPVSEDSGLHVAVVAVSAVALRAMATLRLSETLSLSKMSEWFCVAVAYD